MHYVRVEKYELGTGTQFIWHVNIWCTLTSGVCKMAGFKERERAITFAKSLSTELDIAFNGAEKE